MIIVTGAAGFIGSCFIAHLLEKRRVGIVAVDDFNIEIKEPNYIKKEGILKIDRNELFQFLDAHSSEIDFIIHLGARTDTVDQDKEIFQNLNIQFTKRIWESCAKYSIPLIYASSAATYGDGIHGFDDKMQNLELLEPMNEYGRSKHAIDIWALQSSAPPPYWVGLKFFNVFGPNEYHKGRMASVIFHAFKQIKSTGQMKLFRSHKDEFKDGEQKRDFIYVKDVCNVIWQLMDKQIKSGVYNLGTGKARTFHDLVKGVFSALDLKEDIKYIDIPADIRENYQYFTEAKMEKIKDEGIGLDFYYLEDGIKEYVQEYLLKEEYF